jgi:PPOX class probable F420-dependent enzyme
VAQQMTNEEYWKFMLVRARTAVLATVRANGRPHAAPIWFDLDGDSLVFTTGDSTMKGRNMRRDARVSLCIDEEEPPFHFVVIEGAADLTVGVPTSFTGRHASGVAIWVPTGPMSTAVATPWRGSCWYA